MIYSIIRQRQKTSFGTLSTRPSRHIIGSVPHQRGKLSITSEAFTSPPPRSTPTTIVVEKLCSGMAQA